MITYSFGKYTVTQNLGRGGMAEVYLAHDPVLDRQVAIKVILAHLAADERFVARFRREARLIASLRHPNIVQIFDFDVLHDQPFMVMEYLAGGTLKVRLTSLRTRGERMPFHDSVRLLHALAGALDYAHAQGAVHRDIKPANILFTAQDEPVLADFGIVKLLDQAVQLSMTGGAAGTPAYMSPEQAAGKAVDHRSDLYSLGVVVYELVTGRLPFQADSPAALLLQHVSKLPPAPRTFNPNLPAACEHVLLQALAKTPADRFASAGAFAQAFEAAMHGRVKVADIAPISADDKTLVEQPGATPAFPAIRPQQDLASAQPTAQSTASATPAPVFVGRERELAQLYSFLDRAVAGQGQVCFISGEAGAGKTVLVTAFTQRAQATYPRLVVAMGNCNALSGAGDAYLPFRELLAHLAGLAGTAVQPGSFLAGPGRALAEHGPDLIDIFLPGEAVMAHLAQQPTERSEWMVRLAKLAQATGQESGVEQSHIFEQYTNVLNALAAEQPLLLVVDDLQWVDGASVDLLFHLSRRIGGSRVLLVGTYRPDEVALGRAGAQHPLEKVLAELKRSFGAIEVNLDQEDQASGRRFVDALLDSEPNRLDEEFRRALLRHTHGHALFTVELLRNLQEQGSLTQETTGHWVATSTLDWSKLPPRVEGVIEERIDRLAQELREVLTIASVEGEDFTAEVVARVQKMDERGIIRHLSRELDKHHRLVSAQGRQRVGRQHLSSYRFRHNLFQKYLYNRLDAVERAYFHEDVGAVLEELYGDAADAIAVQLAWHFTEADLPEKARRYLASAGEQALRRYANGEALSYLNRALDLTPEADYAGRYTLLLARQRVYDVLGDRQAQHQDLVQLEELAEKLNDQRRQAEIALCQALYADRLDEYREASRYAQRAIELAAPIHAVEQEAKGYLQWGRALLKLSKYLESRPRLQRALALAEAEQLHQVQADTLRSLGVVAYLLGDYRNAAATYEQALTLYREVGDRRGEGHALNNLGITFREQGNYAGAGRYFDQALQRQQEIGNRAGAADVLVNLGLLCRDQGDHAASRAYYQQALEICRQIGARNAEAVALLGIGDVYKDQEAFTTATSYYEQALLILRAIGDRRQEYLALKELANTALDLGDYTTARAYYEETLACFRQIGDRQSESSTLNRLGLLFHNLGDEESARVYSQDALAIAQEIGDMWLESSSLTKLGHALAGLGHLDAASECYQNAVGLWREQGRPDLALESVAGLARIALRRGKLPQAQAYAEEMLVQFADDTFPNAGMAEEHLACYRVLHASQDARAAEVLSTAYGQLQATAAKIEDEAMRHSYLENVPAHREIVREWHSLSNDAD